MEVLYFGEKYMILNFFVKCIEYILKILYYLNVFCVLKYVELYGFDEFICVSWELIDKEVKEVLNFDDFFIVERLLFEEFVERNLNVKSVVLFKVVDSWVK